MLIAVVLSLLSIGDVAQGMIVNFETIPLIATGPSLFSQAGAAKTINLGGVYSVSGGVVIGFPTNFPEAQVQT